MLPINLTSLPYTTPVNQLNNIVTSLNNQINDLSLKFKSFFDFIPILASTNTLY